MGSNSDTFWIVTSFACATSFCICTYSQSSYYDWADWWTRRNSLVFVVLVIVILRYLLYPAQLESFLNHWRNDHKISDSGVWTCSTLTIVPFCIFAHRFEWSAEVDYIFKKKPVWERDGIFSLFVVVIIAKWYNPDCFRWSPGFNSWGKLL